MKKQGSVRKLALSRETIMQMELTSANGGTGYSNDTTSCANISSCVLCNGPSVAYANEIKPLCA